MTSLQVFPTRPLVRDPYVAPWKLRAQFKNRRSSPAPSFYKWGDDLGNFKGFFTGLFISNGGSETQIQNWLCDCSFCNTLLPVWLSPFGGCGMGVCGPEFELHTTDQQLCFLALTVCVLGEATSKPENSTGCQGPCLISRHTDLMEHREGRQPGDSQRK